MARMIYTEGFLEDASYIWSPKVLDDLTRALEAIETFPKIGSTQIARSIREEFGDSVYKVIVKPFDLIYEYDEAADELIVYGLVHIRQAH